MKKFSKFVIEALQVVEDLLCEEVAERLGEYMASDWDDRYDARDSLIDAREELESFRVALKEESAEKLEYFLSSFSGAIQRSEFGRAFMARQTIPRRRLAQKAEHLCAIKRRDADISMKYEVGIMSFGRFGVEWRDLDSLTRILLNPRKVVA